MKRLRSLALGAALLGSFAGCSHSDNEMFGSDKFSSFGLFRHKNRMDCPCDAPAAAPCSTCGTGGPAFDGTVISGASYSGGGIAEAAPCANCANNSGTIISSGSPLPPAPNAPGSTRVLPGLDE